MAGLEERMRFHRMNVAMRNKSGPKGKKYYENETGRAFLSPFESPHPRGGLRSGMGLPGERGRTSIQKSSSSR